MNPLESFEKRNLNIDLLKKPSQNHKRREYINKFIMTKTLLSYLINDCKYTANYIANKIFKNKGYFVDTGTVIDKCKLYGIKTNTIKDSANNLDVRKRYEKTCIKKYGAKNSLSKGTTAFNKRNKTIKLKYGVNNVFQLQEVKEKSKNTLKKKYGVNNPIDLPSYERNYGRKSKLQQIIEKLLIKNKITFQSEISGKFGKFNRRLNKFYSPIVDILIESKKIVIEVNGDYWHANPKIYDSNDLIYKWNGSLSASEIWKLDRIRNNQIRSQGYKVIVIWESDIRKNIKKTEKKLLNAIL